MRFFTLRELAKQKGLTYQQACYRVRVGDLTPDKLLGRSYLFTERTAASFDVERLRSRVWRTRGFGRDMLTISKAAEELDIPPIWIRNAISRGDLQEDGKQNGIRFLWRDTVEQIRDDIKRVEPIRYRTANRKGL